MLRRHPRQQPPDLRCIPMASAPWCRHPAFVERLGNAVQARSKRVFEVEESGTTFVLFLRIKFEINHFQMHGYIALLGGSFGWRTEVVGRRFRHQHHTDTRGSR
jgi:hypothetical protein